MAKSVSRYAGYVFGKESLVDVVIANSSKKERFDPTKSKFWPKEHCAADCPGCKFRKNGKSARLEGCHGPYRVYNELAEFSKSSGLSFEEADRALASMSKIPRR